MSAKKEYVKLWLSYETYFEPYTPEEIGNLVLAMLRYKDTGEEPVFQGNERFIWSAVRRDIDEAQEAQEAVADRARENGKGGGRPRKASPETQADENPAGFSETQKTTRTKDKDKDNGHSQCQGQGEGQGHPSDHDREKFAAVDRLFAQILAEVKEEAEAQREIDYPL